MSIPQRAAELAEEWKNSDCSNLRELERNGDKMAGLLRQIASMGGDVEPMTLQELDCYLDPTDSPDPGKVYSQQALDAARLAGFEAGRRKGLEEAAVAAWSHYMDTCRKFATGPDVVPDWCAAKAIRELTNKEA